MTQPIDIRIVFVGLALILTAGAFLAPPMPFIIDGGIYLDMASAMTGESALAIAGNGGVDGAPPLTKYLTRTDGDLVYPQYPSGYALLAAPFYKLLGVRGLMLINALSLAASAFLIFKIAARLFKHDAISLSALAIFLLATFVSNYALAIWPHMLSLMLWLGAIACAVYGAEATSTRSRFLWLCASGLVIGLGVNIRVDSILIFAVIFLWLRIFARSTDRLAPLMLVIGAAPLFALAAWLNHLKFGTFSPLSYGSSAGATNIQEYRMVILGGAAILVALWLANIPATVTFARQHLSDRLLIITGAVAALAAMIVAHGFIGETLYGVYVLVINLQAHDAYVQAGVERNEFGQLMFWGYPKKALIQSLPYLPLILISTVSFMRGRNVQAISLCLLAIAAPVSFYAMKQWHGGGSYNMRYFIPALPFIAILCAAGMRDIIAAADGVNRRDILIACVGAAIVFIGAQEVGRMTPALYAPAALYPQWMIALVVAGLAGLFVLRPAQATARATLLVSVFALAYSAFLSIENEASHEKARGELLAHSREISKSIPDRALVLTQLPVLLIHAEGNGAFVMVPRETNIAEAVKAAAAFAKAGRCVYLHNSMVSDLLEPHMAAGAINPIPSWAGREAFPDDPRFAFFTLTSQTGRCSF
ncbi:MAG: hypothetical protein AAFX54_04455 [Pseudomonadota bacterium]